MSTRTVQDNGAERFYHRNGGIIMFFGQDKRVVQDGVASVIDAEKIQFHPCGNHDAGVYSTSRPEIKAYLLSRGDVMTEPEFLEWSRTPEEKLQHMMNREEQMQRDIAEKNQLIADLMARQKAPAPVKFAG